MQLFLRRDLSLRRLHKAAVRQLAGARVACDAAFGLRTAMRTYSPALHPDAVDYYVFSLGRILI